MIPIHIFVILWVLFLFISAMRDYAICTNDCPQLVDHPVEMKIKKAICNNSFDTCKSEYTSECLVGLVSLKDNYFTLKTVETFRDENRTLALMTFETPSFLSTDDPKNFPTYWALNIILNNSTCIKYSFNFKFFIENKGHFSTPCIELNDNSLLHAIADFSFGNQNSLRMIRSQEIKVSIPANYSLWHLWAYKLNYTITKQTFVVSFIANPKHSSYIISIHNESSAGTCNILSPLQTWKSEAVQWKTDVKFDLKYFNSCRTYCIQLFVPSTENTSCFKNCSTHTQLLDTAYFHAPSSLANMQRNCKNWTAEMRAEANPFLQEISLFFRGCCGFEGCFQHFDVYLMELSARSCEYGRISAIHQFHNDSSSSNFIVFKNVSSGTYCIKVYPDDPLCRRMDCTPVDSYIVTIEDVTSKSANASGAASKGDKKVKDIVTFISMAFVVIVFTVAMFVTLQKKINKRHRYEIPPIIPSKDFSATFDSMTSTGIAVTILNTQESSTKDWVFSLVDILRKGSNLTMELLDEQLDDIIASACDSWIISQLKFKSHKCQKNPFRKQIRKVILVESQRAVAYQEYWSQMFANEVTEFGSPYNVQDIATADIALEDAFIGAMRQIMSMQRQESDYFHVVIVHFSSITPKTAKFKYPIPCERYYLPEDLISLCAYLETESVNIIPPPSRLDDLKMAVMENSHFAQYTDMIFEGAV